MTQQNFDISQGLAGEPQTMAAEKPAKKAKRQPLTKEEKLKRLEAQKNAIQAKAARIENRIKRLEKTKEELRKDDGRRKIIAGATVLKMIREGQEFTAEKFKNAILSATKKDEDISYFKKFFNIDK